MDPRGVTPESVPAGDFTTWLSGMRAALAGQADSDVPCGTCTACCTSRQFVHIEPDEADVLAVVPEELLFPAPGQPGHLIMGYDQDGCCPMFVDGACSIYEHRPRTCRVYDCRLFAALGRVNEGTPLIAARIRAWEFTFADDEARAIAIEMHATGTFPPVR